MACPLEEGEVPASGVGTGLSNKEQRRDRGYVG